MFGWDFDKYILQFLNFKAEVKIQNFFVSDFSF
jgi:hypothetical protein